MDKLINDEDFQLLMTRPPTFFRLSEEAQWATDEALGLLDVEGGILSPEQEALWAARFFDGTVTAVLEG